jgi:ketosteroid isomerase-like protein
MVRRNVFIVVALAVVIGVSCSKVAQESVDDAHVITEAYDEWVRAVNAHDIEWWSSFLAPDAVFLPPDSPPLETIDAIRAPYITLFSDPEFGLECTQTFVDVSQSRDLAWTRGTCDGTFSTPSGDVGSTSSKWAKVWVRLDDGTWKCRLNIWN